MHEEDLASDNYPKKLAPELVKQFVQIVNCGFVPPHQHMIHILMNLEFNQKIWFELESYSSFIDQLSKMMLKTLTTVKPIHTETLLNGNRFDEAFLPLIILTHNLAEAGTQQLKNYLKESLFPSKDAAETSRELETELIHLLIHPGLSKIRHQMEELVFECFHHNGADMVQHFGLGITAGLLKRKNMLDPKYFERKHEESDMTEEEKEKEIERLVPLFRRLQELNVKCLSK
jgi:hypothetical protein